MATIGTTTAIAILPPDDKPELLEGCELDVTSGEAFEADEEAGVLVGE